MEPDILYRQLFTPEEAELTLQASVIPSPGRAAVSVGVISFGLSAKRRTGGSSSSGMGGLHLRKQLPPESATGGLSAHSRGERGLGIALERGGSPGIGI